jgi:8-oxo-dGTP pyrophosphatase MutT (NUDIX family)
LRELREETGITGRLERGFVKSIRFVYQRSGMQIHKRVLHFLLQTESPKVTLSKEHQVYAWLPANEACRKLLFQNRKLLIEAAERYLQRKAGRSAQVQHPSHRSRP